MSIDPTEETPRGFIAVYTERLNWLFTGESDYQVNNGALDAAHSFAVGLNSFNPIAEGLNGGMGLVSDLGLKTRVAIAEFERTQFGLSSKRIAVESVENRANYDVEFASRYSLISLHHLYLI
ncbi:MAG: hypothetical protein AAFY76_03600 [Cyanobacteria bacterium J06649_11]